MPKIIYDLSGEKRNLLTENFNKAREGEEVFGVRFEAGRFAGGTIVHHMCKGEKRETRISIFVGRAGAPDGDFVYFEDAYRHYVGPAVEAALEREHAEKLAKMKEITGEEIEISFE